MKLVELRLHYLVLSDINIMKRKGKKGQQLSDQEINNILDNDDRRYVVPPDVDADSEIASSNVFLKMRKLRNNKNEDLNHYRVPLQLMK